MIERTVGQRFDLVAPLSKDETLWYAKDIESGQNATIKFIPISPKKISRWIRLESELQLLRNLAINNMVQIIDWGDCEGGKYVAYEYVDGIRLSQAKLSIQKTISILKQIAQTLKILEQNDFILRDFRIDKIFLLPGSEPFIKIVEFGSITSDQTKLRRIKPNEVLQELSWMPPEVLRYEQRSIKSNLYSMGLVGYYLITGKELFFDQTPSSLVWQIQNSSPPPVSYYNSNVPGSLDTLIRRLLRKDPSSRYDNIEEVIDLLDKSSKELESAISIGSTSDLIINNGLMIGRKDVLDLIKNSITSEESKLEAILISGEDGAGKTRIIQEVASITRSMDYPILSVTCERKFINEPYYALSQLVYDTVNEFGIGIIGKSEHKKIIASICPELIDRILIDPLEIDDENFNLNTDLPKALSSIFMRCLELEEKLVITIDDLPECDTESFEIIFATLAGLSGKPIKIFCAAESAYVFEIQSKILIHLGKNSIKLAQLGSFTLGETAQLVENSIGSQYVSQKNLDKIYNFTKGNPFQVLELLAGIAFKKDVNHKKAFLDDFVLPESLNELARIRCANLDEKTRSILSNAAMLGDSFDEKLLIGVSTQDSIEVEEALDSSVSQMVIQLFKVPTGYKYKFANNLIKFLLLDSLLPKQKTLIHDKAAKTYSSKPSVKKAELMELIDHLTKGSNSQEAIPYLMDESKKALNELDPKQSMTYARMAYDLAIKTADSTLEAITAERLIDILLITGKYEQAKETIDGVLSALRKVGLDNHSEARLLIIQASILSETSQYTESEEILQQAYKMLGRSLDDEMLAKMHLLESKNLIQTNRKESYMHADKALMHANKTNNFELVCQIHSMCATIHTKDGKIELAKEILERQIEIFKKKGFQYEYAVLLMLLSELQILQGEFENALNSLAEAKQISFRLNSAFLEISLLKNDAHLKLMEQDSDVVRRLYERAIDLCIVSKQTAWLCELLIEVGFIYIEEEDQNGARYYYSRCREYEKHNDGLMLPKSNILLAYIYFLESKLDKSEQIIGLILKNQNSYDTQHCFDATLLLSKIRNKQEDFRESINMLKNIDSKYKELAICPINSFELNLQMSNSYLSIIEIACTLPKPKKTAFLSKLGQIPEVVSEAKHHLNLALVASLTSGRKMQSLLVALKWAKFCKFMSLLEPEHANYHNSELSRYISISESLISELKRQTRTARFEEELNIYK